MPLIKQNNLQQLDHGVFPQRVTLSIYKYFWTYAVKETALILS